MIERIAAIGPIASRSRSGAEPLDRLSMRPCPCNRAAVDGQHEETAARRGRGLLGDVGNTPRILADPDRSRDWRTCLANCKRSADRVHMSPIPPSGRRPALRSSGASAMMAAGPERRSPLMTSAPWLDANSSFAREAYRLAVPARAKFSALQPMPLCFCVHHRPGEVDATAPCDRPATRSEPERLR